MSYDALLQENRRLKDKIIDLENKICTSGNKTILGFSIRKYKDGKYDKWMALASTKSYQLRVNIPIKSAHDDRVIEDRIVKYLAKYNAKRKEYLAKFPEYKDRFRKG